MNRSFLGACLAAIALTPQISIAQQAYWVQIEALPSLREAQVRAKEYNADLADVAGFDLGNGWFAVALGPYSAQDAEALLRQLRQDAQIPRDSYIIAGSDLRTQYFPVGTGVQRDPKPLPNTITAPASQSQITTQPLTQPAIETSNAAQTAPQTPAPAETLRQSRDGERALSEAEKYELQRAMSWAGVYNGAIDGIFGRGTRAAMERWQSRNGFEETGILSTRQRAQLLADYNAVFDGLDMRRVEDAASGIAMILPMGKVAFASYDAPFARFDARDGDLPKVLLISQKGTADSLAGLYHVMETLEIVPAEGERKLNRTSFTLSGQSGRISSYSEAHLIDGEIKGFTLVWPAGDEKRRGRVLQKMRDSFTRIPGVLSPAQLTGEQSQTTDMVSGLAIRKPIRSRSGFFIDDDGLVLTSVDMTEDCGQVTINGQYTAVPIAKDAGSGAALFQSQTPIAPTGIATFRAAPALLNMPVTLSGYPYDGRLPAAAITHGSVAELIGPMGEPNLNRLALSAQESEIGGPVFDSAGAVAGILTTPPGAKEFTGEVAFMTPSATLLANVPELATRSLRAPGEASSLPAPAIAQRAANITVVLQCWE